MNIKIGCTLQTALSKIKTPTPVDVSWRKPKPNITNVIKIIVCPDIPFAPSVKFYRNKLTKLKQAGLVHYHCRFPKV